MANIIDALKRISCCTLRKSKEYADLKVSDAYIRANEAYCKADDAYEKARIFESAIISTPSRATNFSITIPKKNLGFAGIYEKEFSFILEGSNIWHKVSVAGTFFKTESYKTDNTSHPYGSYEFFSHTGDKYRAKVYGTSNANQMNFNIWIEKFIPSSNEYKSSADCSIYGWEVRF